MKKLNYLFAILFAVALMSISCEKEDPVVPDGITVDQLIGNWDFVSLEFNGNVTTGCDAKLNEDYAYVTLNFLNMTTNNVMLYTDCVDAGYDPDNRTYDYVLENNKINCENGSRVFEIMNVNTFDGTVLKLKFISSAAVSGFPKDGIYTLEKY